jgi:uncharacterized protein YdcH (DUF465 family)
MSHHDDLKAELIQTDDEFRHLHEEHQQCEQRLNEINHKTLLSEDDEVEEKKIKLHKLALKDKMEHMLRMHQSQVSV